MRPPKFYHSIGNAAKFAIHVFGLNLNLNFLHTMPESEEKAVSKPSRKRTMSELAVLSAASRSDDDASSEEANASDPDSDPPSEPSDSDSEDEDSSDSEDEGARRLPRHNNARPAPPPARPPPEFLWSEDLTHVVDLPFVADPGVTQVRHCTCFAVSCVFPPLWKVLSLLQVTSCWSSALFICESGATFVDSIYTLLVLYFVLFVFAPLSALLTFFGLVSYQAFLDIILPIERECTPKDFFLSIVGRTFFDTLAQETNNYMRDVYSQTHSSFHPHYHLTDPDEMSAFVGGLFALHMFPHPDVKGAWSKDFGIPLLQRHFSRDRFLLLYRVIHFVNNKHFPFNAKQVGFERMQKVRPLIDEILKNSQRFYTLNRLTSADEAMIFFKVCSTFSFHDLCV
jgi:hypothetical protein